MLKEVEPMKAEYERASCDCGWFCLVLKEAKTTVYHCGEELQMTKEVKEGSHEV